MLDKEARNETFSIADVVEIASEVLQALAAIHESEIYHTNLKPEKYSHSLQNTRSWCKSLSGD